MGQWTLSSPPIWFPSATQTSAGWVNPDTGEVLVAIHAADFDGLDAATQPAVITDIAFNGTNFILGQTLNIFVVFDQAVVVTGTPELGITFGSQSRTASYSSALTVSPIMDNASIEFMPAGSGTNIIGFTYTIQAGDTASVGNVTLTSPITLNGGTITNAVGDLVSSVTLSAGGTGYINGSYIVDVTGTPGVATAALTVAGGAITAAAVQNPGEGFSAGSTLTTSAFNLAPLGQGKVTSVTIVNGGSGYTDGIYQIDITGTPGLATVEVTIENGVIVAAVILNPGSGFTSASGYANSSFNESGLGSGTGLNLTYTAGYGAVLSYALTTTINAILTL